MPEAEQQAGQEAAFRLVQALTARGQTVASCESLTGGLLGAVITDVPGASVVYRGGLITYATDLKATLAGVDADQLRRDGAVAEPTAAAMALGVRDVCATDWGLSTTGVAGPDRQEGHPAGTVFVGLAGPDGRVEVERLQLHGDRTQIRRATVSAVLRMLLNALD